MSSSEVGIRKPAHRATSCRTAIARWLLGLVVSMGGAALWVGFVTWFVFRLMAFWQPPQVRETRGVTVQSNGEPVLRVIKYQNQASHESLVSQTFESLDGEPLTLSPAEQWSRDLLSWRVSHFLGSERRPLWRRVPFIPARHPYWLPRDISEPLPWAARLQSFYAAMLEPRGGTKWYFVWPERRTGSGYFVGYDNKSKALLGYLGTEGFSNRMPQVAQQFPAWNQAGDQVAHLVTTDTIGQNQNRNNAAVVKGSMSHAEEGLYFITPKRDQAYRISLTKRTVERVRQDLKWPIDFVSVLTAWNSQGYNVSTNRLLRFADRLEFVDLALQPTSVISLPEELRDSSFSFTARQSGGYVVIPDFDSPPKNKPLYDQPVLWLDEQGNVTQRRTLSLPNPRDRFSEVSDGRLMLPLSLIPANGLAILGLAPFVPMFDDWGERQFSAGESITWTTAAKAIRWQFDRLGWPLWICLLSGLPFTAACIWRQRQVAASLPERLAWPALVYAFGLAGWIAFVAHREWPRRRTSPTA